jgi:hypothetical protein
MYSQMRGRRLITKMRGRRSDPYVSACHAYMLQSAEERRHKGISYTP